MKNILITGGTGFIGSEIVKQLYSTGEWNITVLDTDPWKELGRFISNNIYNLN